MSDDLNAASRRLAGQDLLDRQLRALGDAGILEREYVSASIAKGQSFLRKPGVKK